MFHDSIGNYGYFATSTYPYITGCFGPGNYPTGVSLNCTTNGPSSWTKSIYALNQTTNSTTTTVATTGVSDAKILTLNCMLIIFLATFLLNQVY